MTAFESDTGLAKANALVENVMILMGDFPIDDLLAATDVTQMKRAVEKIFRHLSRLKKANMYVVFRDEFHRLFTIKPHTNTT